MRLLTLRKCTRVLAISLLPALTVLVACSNGDDGSGTPTPTSTPLASERAPTAQVPIPPTPVVDRSPTVGPTATTRARPSATPTPHRTATAATATTAVQPSPTPTLTPTPVPTPTPALVSGRELVNEPLGVLQLRPGIGVAAEYAPGASAANFRLNVEFSNPFHPDFSPWDYGVKFRNDGQTFQMFTFDHRGNLNQINGNGTELEIVQTMAVPGLLTSGGARNDFSFLVIDRRAFILLGQDLIGEFEVTEPNRVGEISLVTDVFNQTVVVGANTEFFNLTINSASVVGISGGGELARSQPDEPAHGDFTQPTSAPFVRVTFVSPVNSFSGDYSFGLLMRTEDIGIDNWLVLSDRKTWRHIRRSTTGAETVLGQGTAETLRTGEGDENLLELVSTGQQNKIYLNGEFITNIGFSPSDLPFTIAPMAGFEPSDQAGGRATEYRDFIVWSVQD